MNRVTLNTGTDENVIEFPQFDFEVEAVIHCAPWFTVPPLPLLYFILFLISWINMSVASKLPVWIMSYYFNHLILFFDGHTLQPNWSLPCEAQWFVAQTLCWPDSINPPPVSTPAMRTARTHKNHLQEQLKWRQVLSSPESLHSRWMDAWESLISLSPM